MRRCLDLPQAQAVHGNREGVAFMSSLDALARLDWLKGGSPRWIDEQVLDPCVDRKLRTKVTLEEIK